MKLRNRLPKGSSFLTHGSDDHDHKAMKKAHRRNSQALINEWLQDDEEPHETPKNPTSWRIVVETQVWENYGAHAWDGDGQCPQHWKAKGGDEYIFELGGLDRMLTITQAEIAKIADMICKKVTRNDEYIQENPITWSVLSNLEETYQEKMDREMQAWGYPPRSYAPNKITI